VATTISKTGKVAAVHQADVSGAALQGYFYNIATLPLAKVVVSELHCDCSLPTGKHDTSTGGRIKNKTGK
jgi:hypothetical protein